MTIYENLKKNTLQVEHFKREINNGVYSRYFDVLPGDVVVDIGAHVGYFTDAALAKGAQFVLCVEPAHDNAETLLKKYENDERVIIEVAAVAEDNTYVKMSGESGCQNVVAYGEGNIPTITFKEIFNNVRRINFAKIDCEGGEYAIFTEENIPYLLQCDKLACEFHVKTPEWKRQCILIIEMMKHYGFKVAVCAVASDGSLGPEITDLFYDQINEKNEIMIYFTSPNYCNEQLVVNFNNGAYFEAKNTFKSHYQHTISNSDTGEVVYTKILPSNNFIKIFAEYYVPYRYKLVDVVGNRLLIDEDVKLEGKDVVIELCSKSLGDTLAWVPYAEEFRKKHKCNVHLITYMNNLFQGMYPDIVLHEPGTVFHNVYAWYSIGWFYHNNGLEVNWAKHPVDFKLRPLQATATDILGLEYKEIKPLIKRPEHKLKYNIGKPYVCIATHSTLQAKYWNREGGWQKIVDYIKGLGFEVVLLSNEHDGHMGNKNPEGVIYPSDHHIDSIITILEGAQCFIGLPSGLTWLAWALGVKTAFISGFAEDYTEMRGALRIGPGKGVCSGCFNRMRLQHDGDWNWCPDHKGTDKQFECTKSITSAQVLHELLTHSYLPIGIKR